MSLQERMLRPAEGHARRRPARAIAVPVHDHPASVMRTALGALGLAIVLALLALQAAAADRLTTADLVRFLKAGISEHIILAELRLQGFAEPLDADREATLRAAGATETLVVAVRRAALQPGTPGSAVSAPPVKDTGYLAPRPNRGPTFGATARSVRVPVSVLDKRGMPVLGLRGEDFKLAEDGRPQPLTFFSGERRPLRIALVLDVSPSMLNKMKQVEDALRHFIALLEPQDEIMVMTFSADVNVDQEFTSDRDLLERVFARLQPAQGTALFDAVIAALRRVAPAPAESKAIVVVSDGVDTASSFSFAEVREVARRSEVPIFSIGIDSAGGLGRMPRFPVGRGPVIGPGRGPRRPGRPGGWPGGGVPDPSWPGGGMGRLRDADFDARPLLDLADDTGGRAEILKGLENDHGSRDRLKEAVESIAVTLRHRYLVGYEPEGNKEGWRKIRVEVTRPAVKVQARKGYYTEES
jgi:VWFA-related protein